MKIALFFLRPWLGNGSTTFTAHLHHVLRQAGHSPRIYRITDAAQPGAKPFGSYAGVDYEVVTLPEARKIAAAGPSLLTALSKPPHVRDGVVTALLAAGTRPVIHHDKDATDFDWTRAKRPICVRQASTAIVPGSVYLPHPYVRATPGEPPTPRRAISTARVAATKRTHLLLEANRLLLPEDQRIEILGVEERLYSKKLKAEYPEFERASRAGAYHLDFDAPVEVCRGAAFNVDMSYFPLDGGGTQYVQLEAMDAGAVNVMHDDWFRFPGDLQKGVHALTAADPQGLADVVLHGEPGEVRANCEKVLLQHSGARVAPLYIAELMKE